MPSKTSNSINMTGAGSIAFYGRYVIMLRVAPAQRQTQQGDTQRSAARRTCRHEADDDIIYQYIICRKL